MSHRLKVATVSLGGCFGCHMSFLDLDERLLPLLEAVEFDRSPLTDIKQVNHCDVGLVEGGVCNEENVHVLRDFRAHCRILVAVGACAINGGIPAMRNHFALEDCLREAYVRAPTLINPQIPADPELPLLLNQVRPIHELVKIDYSLPGCPPSAEVFWELFTALREGREPSFSHELIRFD